MRICFSIQEDKGLESPVYDHFGSAPVFLIADTESGKFEVLGNHDQHHAHGMCRPLSALGAALPDAVVVGGIGAGALMKLNAAGIRVFHAGERTVAQNLQALKEGTLREAVLETACAHHGPHHDQGQNRNGCAHGKK